MVNAQPTFADGCLWRGVAHDDAGEVELASADLGEATRHDAALRAKPAHSRYDIIEPDPA